MGIIADYIRREPERRREMGRQIKLQNERIEQSKQNKKTPKNLDDNKGLPYYSNTSISALPADRKVINTSEDKGVLQAWWDYRKKMAELNDPTKMLPPIDVTPNSTEWKNHFVKQEEERANAVKEFREASPVFGTLFSAPMSMTYGMAEGSGAKSFQKTLSNYPSKVDGNFEEGKRQAITGDKNGSLNIGDKAFEVTGNLTGNAVAYSAGNKILGGAAPFDKIKNPYLRNIVSGQAADTLIQTPRVVIDGKAEGKSAGEIAKDVAKQQATDLAMNVGFEAVGYLLPKAWKGIQNVSEQAKLHKADSNIKGILQDNPERESKNLVLASGSFSSNVSDTVRKIQQIADASGRDFSEIAGTIVKNKKFAKIKSYLEELSDQLKQLDSPGYIHRIDIDADGKIRIDRHKPETVTMELKDLEAIRKIPGKTSVFSFGETDLRATKKWADKFWNDLGKKSPFYRATHGDWRAKSTDRISVTEVEYRPDYDVKQVKRGTFVNRDTGWHVTVGSDGIGDTVSHARGKEYSISTLSKIDELVEKAVLLDSEISEKNNRIKSPDTAFMHKLYAPVRIDGKFQIAKITVEESIQSSSKETYKKFYNLRNIEIPSENSGSFVLKDYATGLIPNGTTVSIADLFEIVKNIDKDFYANSVNYSKEIFRDVSSDNAFLSGALKGVSDREIDNCIIREGLPFTNATEVKNAYVFIEKIGKDNNGKNLLSEATPEEKSRTKKVLAKVWGKVQDNLIDKYSVVKKFDKLDSSSFTDALLTRYLNCSGTADYIKHQGLCDLDGKTIGKSLDDIFSAVPKPLQEDFNSYLVHRYNFERWENGSPLLPHVSQKESFDIITRLEKNNPDFRKNAEDVYAFIGNLDQIYGVGSGIITDRWLQKRKTELPGYLPIAGDRLTGAEKELIENYSKDLADNLLMEKTPPKISDEELNAKRGDLSLFYTKNPYQTYKEAYTGGQHGYFRRDEIYNVDEFMKNKIDSLLTEALRKRYPVQNEENYREIYELYFKITTLSNKIKTRGLCDLDGKIIGKSWNDIISQVPPEQMGDFYKYLFYKYNAERWGNGVLITIDGGNGVPIKDNVSKAESIEIFKAFEKQYPEFKKYSKDIYDFNKKLNHEIGIKSGVKEIEENIKMETAYPSYIPGSWEFEDRSRIFHDIDFQTKTPELHDLSQYDVMPGEIRDNISRKAVSNVFSDIEDVIEEIPDIKMLLEDRIDIMVSAAAQNRLVQNMANKIIHNPAKFIGFGRIHNKMQEIDALSTAALREGYNFEENLRKIYASELKGEYEFSYFENGLLKSISVDKRLFDAFSYITTGGPERAKYGTQKFVDFIGKHITGNFKKLVTVYNPLYAFSNVFRDFPTAYMGTQATFLGYTKAIGEAMQGIFKKDETFRQFCALGGGDSALLNKVLNLEHLPTKVPDLIRRMTGFTEMVPRYAEFLVSLKHGEDVMTALHNAANITVDFSRGGRLVKNIDKGLVPYLNARFQGLWNVFRVLKNHPFKTVGRGTVYLSAPAIALYLVNKNNPHYENLTERQKNYYINFPNLLGDYDDEGFPTTFLKFPKSEQFAFVFSTLVEKALRRADGDKEAFSEIGSELMDGLVPVNTRNFKENFYTPAWRVFYDNIYKGETDIRDFANRPIIPEEVREKPKAEQYNADTSSIGIWLGKTLGVSPAVMDYFVKSYSGIVGDVFLPYFKKNVEKPGLQPFANRFMVDSLYKNDVQTTFFPMWETIRNRRNEAKQNGNFREYYKYQKYANEIWEEYQHCKNIQTAIDGLIAHGASKNSETVRNLRNRYLEILKNMNQKYKQYVEGE